MQAKEGFYALLDGCAELRGGGRPKFSRARDLLELDARWQVRCAAWRIHKALPLLPLCLLILLLFLCCLAHTTEGSSRLL